MQRRIDSPLAKAATVVAGKLAYRSQAGAVRKSQVDERTVLIAVDFVPYGQFVAHFQHFSFPERPVFAFFSHHQGFRGDAEAVSGSLDFPQRQV